jgi:G3E family GTPase
MESKPKGGIIPCHLIAGSLGVGKTSAIRRFIAESPDYVAVIVNDFGQTGYDTAFINEAAGSGGLRVENVPGGCLCCTSAAQLLPALRMLCARPEIKRIIIEPSGIVLLNPLLRMLHDAAPMYGFELAPVIVLFDPAATRPAALALIPYWRHLAECADIAILNRCDLAPSAVVDQFFQCLEKCNPPKLKIIKTSHGKLPPELFDLRRTVRRPEEVSSHHTELPSAGNFRSEKLFCLKDLLELLEKLGSQLERFKGIFQTEQGWFRLEIAAGRVRCTSALEATQSHAEWIGSGSEIADQLKSVYFNP